MQAGMTANGTGGEEQKQQHGKLLYGNRTTKSAPGNKALVDKLYHRSRNMTISPKDHLLGSSPENLLYKSKTVNTCLGVA